MRKEIRITGFGGQGIILAGYVLGKAACVYDDKLATMVQSYGPEARGSACAAQVVIADSTIHDPYVRKLEILAALSQEGYDNYVNAIEDGGVLLYDADLVELSEHTSKIGFKASVPATRIAEKMGRRMAANIVMLGFVTGCTSIVSPDAMKEAVRTSVPPGTEEFNLNALDQGLAHAEKAVAGAGKTAQ
ncbi:2-oxoacid:acceptor oxidoreductase family protein [Candidatus Eisenbacteria bacterium]|uniref:2-oxoacid:acceptor oxidoreductase family protein n=1 Tax=Eiseniibacteriota bacterium TaxID=2212470 RepID=A0ABV6YIC9_UNCEI